MSVNRGGGQAKKKAVEKDDGKYDRDDGETGPVRQKKGANKINISLMMKCSRSQASTRLINDEFDGAEASLSRNSEQERTLMLAKKHASNDTECASGETPSPALLIDRASRTQPQRSSSTPLGFDDTQ